MSFNRRKKIIKDFIHLTDCGLSGPRQALAHWVLRRPAGLQPAVPLEQVSGTDGASSRQLPQTAAET